MAYSNAKTVTEYLNSMEQEKSIVVNEIRNLFYDNMPEGLSENMNWGMICYEVPLSKYPDTYNKKPLMYAAVAAQKNYFSIYLTNLYMIESNMQLLLNAYDKMNIKPDIGKSCIRFKKLNKIPIDTIVKIYSSTDMDEFISNYEKIKR